ncbi:MAG: hypothetical protein IPN63_07870 [Gammaproteobacteria bacterium]|nr:hypothetical protein [Gammaproteobacteria bacterium]
MNLQRREEIRMMIADESIEDPQAPTDCRHVLPELLAHIDTLEQTAAERVIARGAVVKPHTFGEIVNQVRDIASQYAGTEQLRERIAYALAPHFERDGGPTPDYTGEGSAWVPPVEARAVVAPELTEEALVRAGGPYCINDREPFQRGARWAVEFVRERVRAISPDRVLADGMVAVGREDAALAVEWHHAVQDLNPGYLEEKDHATCRRFDALRANQGGAAT